MSVHKKLQQCRVALQRKEIKKSGHNKFAGYNYFELGDFLPVVNELFNDAGLFSHILFTQAYATLTIIDTEDQSQIVFQSPMGSAQLKGCHEVQNIGAVETYQRRYLYIQALEIVEHDALDASEPIKTTPRAYASPHKATDGVEESLSEEQRAKVRALVSPMIDWLNNDSPADAVLVMENAELEAEEKIYLSTFFDSKQRATLKKAIKELRENSQLGEQA